MYSKEKLITAIGNEFQILKHLGNKVEAQYLDHRFTEKQRTIHELMAYLAFSIEKQVQLIVIGQWEPSIFNNMDELTKTFDYKQWDDLLATEEEHIVKMIRGLEDEAMDEEIALFGKKGPRSMFLVDYLLTFFGAYKMQLFLQLKHAGRSELGMYNLWAGIDAPEAK